MGRHLISKKRSCIVVLLVFIALAPPCAFGWGDEGHRITARIASTYLTPQARSVVVDLLKTDIASNRTYYQNKCPDVSSLNDKTHLSDADSARFVEMGLACIAPWPDPPLKGERLYTSNWHFVDIPVILHAPNGPTLFTFDISRDCRMDDERGDCAVLALRRLRPVLANPKEQKISRAEALKFVVHIIGDLHQPLHCVTDKKDAADVAELGDIGGNGKIVQFNVPAWSKNANNNINPRWNEHWNLHSVWDEGIIDAVMSIDNLQEDQYVERLLASLAKMQLEELTDLQAGDSLKWINDSYQVAIENAYNLPAFDKNYQYVDKKGHARTGGYILSPAYFASNRDVVDEQLQTGGVRLGRLLNQTFLK